MSIENDLRVISNHCEDMEERMNKELQTIMENHGKGVLANVLVNLGTSLLAKAVILTREEHKDVIIQAISHAMAVKVSEGEAAVETLMAIDKAMQMRH